MLILKTSKCWVWFKGSLKNGGHWKEGFTCTFDEKPGVLIESPAYVTCRVPKSNPIVKLMVVEGRRANAIGIPRNDVLPINPASCNV